MEFDQEHTQIFMPDQWLRQRVRTGDSKTNVLFSQQCEELVSGMTKVDETTANVRRLLIHSAGNFLSISGVAEKLHITERTLRRRLTAEETNFRTIFDDIRNTLARNYLSKTSLSVVEIADLLNYSEATNFHRAFQRWNSTTPADYRQQASLICFRTAEPCKVAFSPHGRENPVPTCSSLSFRMAACLSKSKKLLSFSVQ